MKEKEGQTGQEGLKGGGRRERGRGKEGGGRKEAGPAQNTIGV